MKAWFERFFAWETRCPMLLDFPQLSHLKAIGCYYTKKIIFGKGLWV